MRLSREDQKRRELAEAKSTLGPAIIGHVMQVPTADLVPYSRNARTHDDKQLAIIERSLQTFGFTNPVLIDAANTIVAGHGRVAAAKRMGLTHVPAIRIEGLTPDQLRAYRLADNRIAELAGWNQEMLAIEFQHLTSIELDFNIETIGWDMPQIDILLDAYAGGSARANDEADPADELPEEGKNAVSRLGDLWRLGRHRVMCASALDAAAFARLMDGRKAAMLCQDPPWNIAVSKISGLGKVSHRPFPMANGDMTNGEFRQFLREEIRCNIAHAEPGAVVEIFIDWRGIEKVIAAGEAEGLELVNVCVWVKSNGGMGSLFRSQHELIVVFRKPGGSIKNNVQLGRFGRYRTNVWQVAGQNSFGAERMEALESHPTRKPVELIAEAMRDVTDIGDIVLDSFLGSGTAVLAAERTGRIAYGIELDPLYVDTTIRRWEKLTGHRALLDATGRSFGETEIERSSELAEPRKLPVRTRTRRIAQDECPAS